MPSCTASSPSIRSCRAARRFPAYGPIVILLVALFIDTAARAFDFVDFEDPPLAFCCDGYSYPDAYIQHGYALTPIDDPATSAVPGANNALSRHVPITTPTREGVYFHHNGTVTMAGLNYARPSLFRPDGQPFAIHSVDIAEYSTVFAGEQPVFLRGFKSDGSTIMTTLVLDGLIDGPGGVNDFERFLLDVDWTDLTRLEFDGDRGYVTIGLDNLILDVVPEPSTGMLMGAGLVALSIRRRGSLA